MHAMLKDSSWHRGKTMKNSSLLAATALFLFGASAPAFAEDFQGHVTKQNTRLIRPADPEQIQLQSKIDLSAQTPKPAALGISDSGFVLKANKMEAAATSLDGWNPYRALSERATFAPHGQSLISGAAQASQPAATVDYDAIERAYADALPRPPAPRPSRRMDGGAGGNCMVASSPWAMQAAAVGRLGANGTLLQQQGQPRVDVDNCRCEMAVPTTECVQGRMTNFGTNVNPNAGPRVNMPGAAPRVMAPMMRTR
jgi:hypothetical protein